MSQIILIEPNDNLREILSLNLQTYLGCSVIIRDSAEDAIELMLLLPEIDLIISRNIISNENSAEILIKYISENDYGCNLIILGEFRHHLDSHFVNIKNHLDWEETIATTARLLSIDENLLKNKIEPEFIPIPIDYFLPIKHSACDVFIRIKKSVDQFQYVKRIHSGDNFSKAMILKYIDQGLRHFYISKEDHIHFTNHVSDQLINKLEQEHVGSDDHLKLLADAHHITLNEVKLLGFNSATVQLTDAIISDIEKILDTTPEISKLLKKIVNTKTNYLYQHSHMTSLLAGEIVKHMNVDNSHHVRVVAFASLFKDIFLVDHPELAKISSFSELEDQDLPDEDWELVFNHAHDASILINKYKDAPEGIDEVLKTHHGSQNGKGYSMAHVERLGTLEQIFIVCCEFVREILIFKEKGGMPKPVIKTIYEKFQGEEVIQIIKALEKVLLNLQTTKKA
ncbi:MAG: hypothetical protein HN576_10310 [Bacteriovoracaceae bacterium]|jgi:hypothetical protein|nr:hypothetical protein [Bacteriovoracaceae bacterium]